PRPTKLLGSTADRIVRQSPVPVLLATNPGKSRPQQLLVPVDDADVTTHLLSYVHDLAAALDANVTLLHAWSNSLYSYVASMSHATTKNEAQARADIDKEMAAEGKRWLEELARTGLPQDRVNAMVTYGDAGDATLETADKIGADLIVMGKQGSGLVAPALLGSTVGTVLHGARCPVLVVTPARA
ncbi:MAG TPA: universal stress protein, partial [Gemmatimonadaceae bacterium]